MKPKDEHRSTNAGLDRDRALVGWKNASIVRYVFVLTALSAAMLVSLSLIYWGAGTWLSDILVVGLFLLQLILLLLILANYRSAAVSHSTIMSKRAWIWF